ncbi:universal stress protein [Haloarchaeobius iranensis]|uniref:Nucleotide-binding universal stress protein, UspA family n=1 Tax=Haloarchaeobius iranensis TaxID=996166 RepID=A0A1H0A6J7_9EURY|nr:universal stress protein [Haloarchaeobius iranensis]SDN29238.1 Nucleotide-binding universal stress protein, UspA family [Haloarchaeobius iranensis]
MTALSTDPFPPSEELADVLERPPVRTETVLVPVGPSDGHRAEALAETAAEAAGLLQTTVRILHVFTESQLEQVHEELAPATETPLSPDEAATHVQPVRAVAGELCTPLRQYGTTMDVTGRVGDDVSREIVAAAEAVDAKRVFVGGRKRTPAGKVRHGSTAQQVLLDAPCPVTFVRDFE